MKRKIPLLTALAATSLFLAGSVQAVPWCHGGHIVTVADVTWDYNDLLNETSGMTVPPNVINGDYYLAHTAGANYCQAYTGGGGPGNVPGKGTVSFVPYAPYSFTNGFNYQLFHGLQFECNKCYAVPPLEPAPADPAPAEPEL